MVCELVRAEALVVTVPLRVPLAVGENLTLMVQSLSVVNSLGLLLVSAKSRLILMPVIFSGVAPGLLSVNTCRGERGGRRSDSRGADGQRCISKGAGKGRARSLQQHGY
jgi:hypothetical protein